jgi:hypothetical protein
MLKVQTLAAASIITTYIFLVGKSDPYSRACTFFPLIRFLKNFKVHNHAFAITFVRENRVLTVTWPWLSCPTQSATDSWKLLHVWLWASWDWNATYHIISRNSTHCGIACFICEYLSPYYSLFNSKLSDQCGPRCALSTRTLMNHQGRHWAATTPTWMKTNWLQTSSKLISFRSEQTPWGAWSVSKCYAIQVLIIQCNYWVYNSSMMLAQSIYHSCFVLSRNIIEFVRPHISSNRCLCRKRNTDFNRLFEPTRGSSGLLLSVHTIILIIGW